MKYLKLMPYNSVIDASRNKREMKTAAEVGFSVLCYCRDKEVPFILKDECFEIICNKTPDIDDSMPKLFKAIRIVSNVLRHASKVRAINADVISCHNLPSLIIARLAYFMKSEKERPKLIYDSHEFELYKKKRDAFSFFLVKKTEGFLIRKCAFSIMVNDGIANEVKKIHNLKQDPVVIRSVPEEWIIEEKEVLKRRNDYCKKLNVRNDSFITIYIGNIMKNRGLEDIIRAMSYDTSFYSVWVGNPFDNQYETELLKMAEELRVANRIIRYPSQPHRELGSYIAAASASIIVMNDKKNINYHYALPNKFFESIQALTPIICTNSLEMSKLVDKYNIGILVPCEEPKALACAIASMRENAEKYNEIKRNMFCAKSELNWATESIKLKDAFYNYL